MNKTTIVNGRVVEIRKTAVGLKYIDRPQTTMEQRYEARKAEQRKEKMLQEALRAWDY